MSNAENYKLLPVDLKERMTGAFKVHAVKQKERGARSFSSIYTPSFLLDRKNFDNSCK